MTYISWAAVPTQPENKTNPLSNNNPCHHGKRVLRAMCAGGPTILNPSFHFEHAIAEKSFFPANQCVKRKSLTAPPGGILAPPGGILAPPGGILAPSAWAVDRPTRDCLADVT
jgi:hypothetical protein